MGFYKKLCPDCIQARAEFGTGGCLTPRQEKIVYQYATKITLQELMEKTGLKKDKLFSWIKRTGAFKSFDSRKGPPEHLVRDVFAYYKKHGGPKTEKKFPHVFVKSMVGNPKHRAKYLTKPLWDLWKPHEKVELIRMRDIVSHEAQAKYFNRRQATAASVSHYLSNQNIPKDANGMSLTFARNFVSMDCPYLTTPRGKNTKQTRPSCTCLWVDMERYIRDDCPAHMVRAIKTMAKFQRWIFKTDTPRHKILNMIKSREIL